MREVIEKLEAASQGSRELDGELFWLLQRSNAERIFWNASPGLPRELPDRWVRVSIGLGKFAVVSHAPAYTTSLDAALALAERVLPGAEWRGGSGDGKSTRPWSRLGPWKDPDAVGATPALALCIAILKAHPSKSIRGGE